jgi:hypothetical protein
MILLEGGTTTMGLFAKAASKKTTKSTAKKTETVWKVDGQIGDAVHKIAQLDADEKAIKAKKSLAVKAVLKVAKSNHVRDFCAVGVPPTGAMKVQNDDGDSVTFIVQDRSGQYGLKGDQTDQLGQLFGEDAAEDMVYSETKIGFDRTILAIDGVSDAVEKALTAVIKKLIKEKKLTEEQADALIDAKESTSFKPGTMARAAELCGRDTVTMTEFFDLMGSSCTRYIKS